MCVDRSIDPCSHRQGEISVLAVKKESVSSINMANNDVSGGADRDILAWQTHPVCCKSTAVIFSIRKKIRERKRPVGSTVAFFSGSAIH